MLVRLWLTYNLSIEFQVHVVLENFKKLDNFEWSTLLMILYVCIKSSLTLLALRKSVIMHVISLCKACLESREQV